MAPKRLTLASLGGGELQLLHPLEGRVNQCPNGCAGLHSVFGKFCTKCGAPLIQAPLKKCACGASVLDSYNYCGRCGVPLKALANAAALGHAKQETPA